MLKPSYARTFLCLVFLSSGCSMPRREKLPPTPEVRKETTGTTPQITAVATGLTSKSVNEMAQTDVIVAVNGVQLTRHALDVSVAAAVQRASARPGVNQQALTQMRGQIARKFVPEFIKRQLLLQEAKRLGVKPSSAAQEKAEQDFAKMAEGLGMTVEELRHSPSPQAVLIREAREVAPLIDALLQEKVYPGVDVTDELVTNTIAAIDHENKEIARRNEERKSLLAKCRADVLAGGDFGALADEHSQCPRSAKGEGGYWGNFERAQIPDRDLADKIFNLKTNEISGILEDEEGFRIVKILNRQPEIKNSNQEIEKRESCEVAHILLLREPPLINLPPAGMKRELIRQRTEQLTNEYLEQLEAKAKIDYPNGTNLWTRAASTNEPTRRTRPPRKAGPRMPFQSAR